MDLDGGIKIKAYGFRNPNLSEFDHPNNNDWPLHEAAKDYNHKALKIKLAEGANPNTIDGSQRTPLHFLLKDGFLGHLHREDMETCLRILIKYEADVNAIDENKKTPLYYAITNTFPECARLLLQNGADLAKSSLVDKSNCTLANQMALKMPDVLRDVFDRSVTLKKHGEESKIRLDWRPILQFLEKHDSMEIDRKYYVPGDGQRETSFLQSLLKGDHATRKKLFTHPLLSAFLHLKYHRVTRHLWLFYIAIILFPLCYMAFVYYVYFYACDKYEPDTTTETPTSTTVTSTSQSESKEHKCEIKWQVSLCAYILAVIVGVWSLIESYMFLRMDFNYIRQWRTWVTAFSLVCMAFPLWPGIQFDTLYDITFQYPLAALGIFFAFVMFLLQIGSHPQISIYLEVLAKIVMSVLKIVLLFLPLLIGFYMGFRLMFDDRDSIFRYIIMTVDVGTAEYEEMLADRKGDDFWFNAMGYIFSVCFIVIIVIVFMNFVLGTSINDIQILKHKAKISILSQKIQNLFTIDLTVGRFTKINCCVITLEELRIGKYYYEFTPNDAKCPIPEHIQTKLIDVIYNCKRNTVVNLEEYTDNENSNAQGSLVSSSNDAKYEQLMRKMVYFESKMNDIISKLDSLEN